jgi:predicted amidohydrolase
MYKNAVIKTKPKTHLWFGFEQSRYFAKKDQSIKTIVGYWAFGVQ